MADIITKPVETEIKFGPSQLKNPTPAFAKTIFQVTAVFTTALAIWVAATGLIADGPKVEIILGLKCFDTLIYALSKLFGIEPKNQ